MFSWQFSLFQSPPTPLDFTMLVTFSSRNAIYMLAGSCILGAISKYQNRTPRKAFNNEKVWNLVGCHGNRTGKSNTYSRNVLQRIQHFWLAEISFFVIWFLLSEVWSLLHLGTQATDKVLSVPSSWCQERPLDWMVWSASLLQLLHGLPLRLLPCWFQRRACRTMQ